MGQIDSKAGSSSHRPWGIDLETLASWLEQQGETASPPLRASRIGRGQSNLVILAEDQSGMRWVLRRPPLGELLESAHDVAREHRILTALGTTKIPIPRVVGLIEDRKVATAPCLVMTHVEGVSMDTLDAIDQLSPSARGDVASGLIDVLAEVHSISPRSVGLAELASERPYADRQLYRWSRQWESTKPDGLHVLDELTLILRQSAPSSEERVIVHGDVHLRNVIVSRGGAIRALLDWELSTLGDPLADLGTLLAYWPQRGDPDTVVFQGSRAQGFPKREEMVEAYATTTGRDVSHVAFWHVLGLWKVAIIGQGVFRRLSDDPGNMVKGAPMRQGDVDAVAMSAFEAARQTGLV